MQSVSVVLVQLFPALQAVHEALPELEKNPDGQSVSAAERLGQYLPAAQVEHVIAVGRVKIAVHLDR